MLMMIRTTLGLNGGLTRRCSKASQSKSLKNAWLLICDSFPEQPKRRAGFFVIKPEKSDENKLFPYSDSVVFGRSHTF